MGYILAALRAIHAEWPVQRDVPFLHERLKAFCDGVLADRLCQAGQNAVAAGKYSNVDVLLLAAVDVETLLIDMRQSPIGLRMRMLDAVLKAHLGLIDAIANSHDCDFDLLKQRLVIVYSLCQENTTSMELCGEIVKSIASLGEFLIKQLIDADAMKAMRILDIAEAAHSVHAFVEQQCFGESACAAAELLQQIQQVHVVAGKLRDARKELAITTGMNPKFVLHNLRSLCGFWPSLAGTELLAACLVDTFNQFNNRLSEACLKSIGNVAKGIALLTFGTEVDRIQEALSLASAFPYMDVTNCRGALSDTLANAYLDSIDTELSKDSHLNPVQILMCLGNLGELWPSMRATEAKSGADGVRPHVHERLKQAISTVCSRVHESMRSALAMENQAKHEALLRFALEFDTVLERFADDISVNCLTKGLQQMVEFETAPLAPMETIVTITPSTSMS